MSRAKEFDEPQVVGRAMQVFWELGYDGTSMSDLLRVTGLSRSSLYATFGGKRALFLRTVGAYVEDAAERRRRSFDRAPSFVEGMASYLGGRLEIGRVGSPAGCYLTSISASLKTADRELRRIVQGVASEAERELRGAFARALAAGEVSRRLDAAGWTRLFLGLFWGLNVASRMGRPREDLAEMISAFQQLLTEGRRERRHVRSRSVPTPRRERRRPHR